MKKKMNHSLSLLLVVVVCITKITGYPWLDSSKDPSERAKELVKEMTLDEKISMVHGEPTKYTGRTPAIDRLKIPAIEMQDGPNGVARMNDTTGWPGAQTLVASWDKELALKYYKAQGLEFRGKGSNVALGPMVNLARVPMSGRLFESMGEDPVLASAFAVAATKGIQSNGVLACVKRK